MKWFKHDSSANRDAKLQKLRMKYGLEGYGLYWFCVELIAEGVDETNLTFQLEHDAEIIAFSTGVHHERVQEMMAYMVKLNLFENVDGEITCSKLAKRIDQSSTSNPQMRKLIAQIKKNPDFIKTMSLHGHDAITCESQENHDSVMTKSQDDHDGVTKTSDQIRLDKNRLDKKGKKTSLPPDFEIDDLMRAWFDKQNFSIDIDKATDAWKDAMLKDTTKYRYTDWVATWRSGMRKAQEWYDERNSGNAPPQQTRPRRTIPKPGSEK